MNLSLRKLESLTIQFGGLSAFLQAYILGEYGPYKTYHYSYMYINAAFTSEANLQSLAWYSRSIAWANSRTLESRYCMKYNNSTHDYS